MSIYHMDPGNEDPSSTAQGMGSDEGIEKIRIIVEALPRGWSISFPVKSSCTIWRLIHDMESKYRNSHNTYQYKPIIKFLESFEEMGMLVFQWNNLLEHGSSTLWDVGINDQDKLLIPFKGPFTILISISPSSFGQQQGTKSPDLQLPVEPIWTVLTLKEKIKTKINIPIKKLTLCCVREGFDNEKCHLVMHDSMTLAAYGIMEGGHCIGLYFEDDQPTKEYGGGPL